MLQSKLSLFSYALPEKSTIGLDKSRAPWSNSTLVSFGSLTMMRPDDSLKWLACVSGGEENQRMEPTL